VVEADHQARKINLFEPGVVSPCFPQRMAPVIPPEADLPAPALNQAVDAAHPQGLPAPLGPKQEITGAKVVGINDPLDSPANLFIQRNFTGLAGLVLLDLDELPRTDGRHLVKGDPGQVTGPEIGVDPQDKQSLVPWVPLQEFLDSVDIRPFPDRFYLDPGAQRRVIGILGARFGAALDPGFLPMILFHGFTCPLSPDFRLVNYCMLVGKNCKTLMNKGFQKYVRRRHILFSARGYVMKQAIMHSGYQGKGRVKESGV
jgi:hypothetical protein